MRDGMESHTGLKNGSRKEITMTYQEYINLKERMTQVEQKYTKAWEDAKTNGIQRKKLARLANELNRLNDQLTKINWRR